MAARELRLTFQKLILGGHSHPRGFMHEPKTPTTLHQKSLENRNRHSGLYVQRKKAHDFASSLPKHEFNSLRPNSGYVGRSRGKFTIYVVYFCCLDIM